jgi:hypothetical protein
MLAEALNIRESTINWSDPVQTFPLLLRAVNIDEFTEPILSGLVVSVGGLTESVAKSSIASLFEWIRALRAANATSRIIRMGEGETNVCFFCNQCLITHLTYFSVNLLFFRCNNE